MCQAQKKIDRKGNDTGAQWVRHKKVIVFYVGLAQIELGHGRQNRHRRTDPISLLDSL